MKNWYCYNLAKLDRFGQDCLKSEKLRLLSGENWLLWQRRAKLFGKLADNSATSDRQYLYFWKIKISIHFSQINNKN